MPGTCKPRIGLTTWRRELPTPLGERTDLYTLGAEYVARVAEAGGIPLLIPRCSDADELLDALDGLIVTGGGDVAAQTYGAADEGTSHDCSTETDDWEIRLIRAAQSRRLPVLGICRGMQIMAVCAGGALQQEIAGTPGHPRMEALDPAAILATRHAVEIDPRSTLGGIYAREAREVNTLHHQTVRDAGEFRVAARSSCGHIEAMEARDDWPALAVQWHPEKMDQADEVAMERKLFRHFIGLAETYAGTHARVHDSTGDGNARRS